MKRPPTGLLCKAVLSILWVPAGCIRSLIYLTDLAAQERLTQLFSGQVYPTTWGEATSTKSSAIQSLGLSTRAENPRSQGARQRTLRANWAGSEKTKIRLPSLVLPLMFPLPDRITISGFGYR